MQTVENLLEVLRIWARKLGPYILLEVLLPGGTLLALLLLLYRRGQVLRAAAQAVGDGGDRSMTHHVDLRKRMLALAALAPCTLLRRRQTDESLPALVRT